MFGSASGRRTQEGVRRAAQLERPAHLPREPQRRGHGGVPAGRNCATYRCAIADERRRRRTTVRDARESVDAVDRYGLDEPEHVLRGWRQIAFLSWHERPHFPRHRYARLLRANGKSQRRPREGTVLEPLLRGARHAPLPRRRLRARPVRSAQRRVDWVEKGVAPESVIATGKAFPGRSRPLCAYPKYASYTGKGDPEDAKSFVCRE